MGSMVMKIISERFVMGGCGAGLVFRSSIIIGWLGSFKRENDFDF